VLEICKEAEVPLYKEDIGWVDGQRIAPVLIQLSCFYITPPFAHSITCFPFPTRLVAPMNALSLDAIAIIT
jgi:hypothetical protein